MFEKLSKTQPIGRMGTPEEIAAAAVFLCSDEASFITGCAYPVDGGTMYLKVDHLASLCSRSNTEARRHQRRSADFGSIL